MQHFKIRETRFSRCYMDVYYSRSNRNLQYLHFNEGLFMTLANIGGTSDYTALDVLHVRKTNRLH